MPPPLCSHLLSPVAPTAAVTVATGKAVSPEVLLERVLQSVTEALEDTDSELSLVYFHAGFQWAQNCPSLHWLQQLFARLPEAFFQRLARVLVVHPTVGLRAALFLVGPWMPQRWICRGPRYCALCSAEATLRKGWEGLLPLLCPA